MNIWKGWSRAVPRQYTMRERAVQMTETREQILAAARDLYAEVGISGTTIRMICDRADVAPGTFRNHFPTRDDLDQAMIEELTQANPLPALTILDGARSMNARLDRLFAAAATFLEGGQEMYRMWE